MSAALRRGRRGLADPRTNGSPKPSRRRGALSATRGISKVDAAKGAGVSRIALFAGVVAVVLACGAGALATGGRGARLIGSAGEAIDKGLVRLGFGLTEIRLRGATPAARQEILQAAALHRGVPTLTMDLDALRARVEKVAWVKRATVIRLLPNTVAIAIDQRPLIAVWEHAGAVAVVAADGTVVAKADPSRYASLPLIVGAGANLAVASIMPAVTTYPRLRDRLDALVRVDGRRWDLRLKDGCLIQLPAESPEQALERLDRLDAKSRVLELGLGRIDLRDPAMIVVRPRENAAPVLSSGGI